MALRTARSIEEVLAVANARHGPGGHWHTRARAGDADHDHLRRPDDAARFLADHGVAVPAAPPSPSALRALGRLADTVRALAAGSLDPWPTLAVRRLISRARYRLAADGTLASAAPDPWDRIVDELAAAAVGLRDERGALRVCGNGLCRFVFLDRSRNRSRRWCDMAACGNRAKARRFRGRRRRRSAAEWAGPLQPGRISGLKATQPATTSTGSPTSSSRGRRSGR